MYIVAKIADHSIVKVTGVYYDKPPSENILLDNIVKEFGGATGDYAVLNVDDKSTDALQISKNWSFTLIWSGDTITGIDFTAETAKKWIEFFNTSDQSTIEANDREAILLGANVLLDDGLTIDNTFNDFVDVPITTPSTSTFMRFYFVKGKSSKSFKTDIYGQWTLPSNSDRFNNFRVKNQLTFNSIIN